MDINNFDVDYFVDKMKKVFNGHRFEDPHKMYVQDVRVLTKYVSHLIKENKKNEKMIKGAHDANDKMQNRKYRMINLLTTIDSLLPEPADPSGIPDDYKFEINVPWGLIKTIRSIIKGT